MYVCMYSNNAIIPLACSSVARIQKVGKKIVGEKEQLCNLNANKYYCYLHCTSANNIQALKENFYIWIKSAEGIMWFLFTQPCRENNLINKTCIIDGLLLY